MSVVGAETVRRGRSGGGRWSLAFEAVRRRTLVFAARSINGGVIAGIIFA